MVFEYHAVQFTSVMENGQGSDPCDLCKVLQGREGDWPKPFLHQAESRGRVNDQLLDRHQVLLHPVHVSLVPWDDGKGQSPRPIRSPVRWRLAMTFSIALGGTSSGETKRTFGPRGSGPQREQ